MSHPKLILAKDLVKRSIEFPFEICGSREDFESLIRQIRARLDRDEGWSYGWVQIWVEPKQPHSAPNSAPLDWTA